jgi:hypothetical protein
MDEYLAVYNNVSYLDKNNILDLNYAYFKMDELGMYEKKN